MDTELSARWQRRHDHLAEDQHPGCHTHSGGFDYVAHYGEADKRIDALWLQQARRRLVQLLANRQAK